MERQEKHCSLMLENWWLGIDVESSMILRCLFCLMILLIAINLTNVKGKRKEKIKNRVKIETNVIITLIL